MPLRGATFYSTIEQIKFKRADVNVLRITQPAITGASALLAALRAKIEEWRGAAYAGRGSPSSGFIGLWLMLQICDSVDVYGGDMTCSFTFYIVCFAFLLPLLFVFLYLFTRLHSPQS